MRLTYHLDQQIQPNSRHYVANTGAEHRKFDRTRNPNNNESRIAAIDN